MKLHPYTETHCEMCNAPLDDADRFVREMYDPNDPHGIGSLIVHLRCGIARDWQVVK